MREPVKKTVKIKASSKPKPKAGKSNAQKLDSFAKNVYKYAGPENFVLGGLAGKAAKPLVKTIKKTIKKK
jgi:hypothetical protein